MKPNEIILLVAMVSLAALDNLGHKITNGALGVCIYSAAFIVVLAINKMDKPK